MSDDDPCIEIRIGADSQSFWMRQSALKRGEGPIMPEPNHDENGMFADSYAHLFEDGTIRRYNAVIGKREEIVVVWP